MASKLTWTRSGDGLLSASGPNTGTVFLIGSAELRDGSRGYQLSYGGGFSLFADVFDAMDEAADVDGRDEDPNNTFGGDFAGFAGNH